MTPDWLSLLATLRSGALAREGLDARAVTDAAERGEAWAIAWVDSPAWDVAHEIVGWRDFAGLHRWMVLTAPRKSVYVPSAAEILASAALLAAEYEACERSTERLAVRLAVSARTVCRRMDRLGIARQAAHRPRLHQEAA
jgi:hypothetical protein